MDKPILFYEVRVHQNRITGGPVYVPAIVEREEAVPLDVIIERAIDRESDDPETWKDSGVEIRVCAEGDRAHYYHFVVNARGCVADAKGFKPGRTRWIGWHDWKWNSGATARVAARADGWTTELRIPASVLGESSRNVPIEFMRGRVLKSGKNTSYYKWSQVAKELSDFEFFGTVRLP